MVSSRVNLKESLLFAAITLTTFVGCGPTVKSSIAAGAALPTTIAVLPADYSGTVARERVDFVRTAVISELRNRNFVIIDDKIVNSVCSTPLCPEKGVLSSKYLVDGFASVTVSSFTKNNLLAGYYNALEGTLRVTDKDGKELVTVSQTEDETGGVLLQSGQLFQGLIDQAKHSGDQVFYSLASKFARSTVTKIPGPTALTEDPSSAAEGTSLALTSVSLKPLEKSAYEICANGTPNSFASVVFSSGKASLREVTPGKYCGAFDSEALAISDPSKSLAVELRTAFGNAARKDLSDPFPTSCDLSQYVALKDEGGKNVVSLSCASVGGKDAMGNTCIANQAPCKLAKVLVYKANDPLGPYLKVADTNKPVWSDSSKVSSNKTIYQVVGEFPAGSLSRPIGLEAVN